jgi:hypothetical protein
MYSNGKLLLKRRSAKLAPEDLAVQARVNSNSPASHQLLQLQGILGNQAVVRLLTQTGPGQPASQRAGSEKANVIQRMIVIPINQIDPGRLMVVRGLKGRYPNEKVATFDHADLSTMGAKEKLYMVAHGEIDKWAKLSAEEIAEKLAAKGYKVTEDSIIKLVSCFSGEGDEKSLAKQLAEELDDKAKVVGLRGFEVTSETGRSRGMSENEQEDKEYQEIIARYKNSWAEAVKLADEVKGYLTDGLIKPENEGALIMSFADTIYKVVENMFRELWEHNEIYANSKDQSKYRSK